MRVVWLLVIALSVTGLHDRDAAAPRTTHTRHMCCPGSSECVDVEPGQCAAITCPTPGGPVGARLCAAPSR